MDTWQGEFPAGEAEAGACGVSPPRRRRGSGRGFPGRSEPLCVSAGCYRMLRGAETFGFALSPAQTSPKQRMLNIADLPEDVLLDMLSWVPAKELVLTCRLVCSHWRDLVDLPTPWKRKCQREGYYNQQLDRSIHDWRAAYFLFSLRRNLIKNPAAEEGFNFWDIRSNGGDKWKIEELPGDHGKNFPDPLVQKYFVTSYSTCTKQQLINLEKEGYWNQLMDEAKPAIVVQDWYAARFDCGCQYQLSVKLLSSDYIVLAEFSPKDVVIEQWSDAEWHKVLHTFRDYPSGVRYILFWHGGSDTQYWAGWYGIRVTNSSITITPDIAE